MDASEQQSLPARVAALERWRREHTVESELYRRQTDERLKVIEPIAGEIAEILKYTKTTSQVVIWTARVAGSIATLVGVIVAVTRWVM
jgi:hypothetical protein